ncbi:MAG: hypothetical protein ACP5TV_08055 [Anaerolineae bacterium]
MSREEMMRTCCRELVHKARVGLLVLAVLLFAGACGTPAALTPTPTATAPAAVTSLQPADDEEAIVWVLEMEGRGVVDKDIDLLMSLWVEDGRVVDARHTPDDPSDDLVWQGYYAIRDRYITLVFPGNPSQAAPADLQIALSGDRAVVTSTTQIGAEVSPAGDRWTLVRTPAGWRIESLTYNLEPAP